ncbi:hypothetical protein GCM10009760_25910 [Kitasatospora kazusensis]|uniref:Head fiber protein n=2 Tax=Kitasatospora kazusensis TaxID=407974 RepID=A0ABN2ZFU8_9ACTN
MAGPAQLTYDPARRQVFAGPTQANATATGVQNPANAAYTVADQTALAATVQQLTATVNVLLAALRTANILDS